MIFRSHGLLQIKQGTLRFPCVGFANYPFVNLPPGNTLRCKLFPFDKFYKISLYFDGRIKYNEVNDKLEVFHELYWEVF